MSLQNPETIEEVVNKIIISCIRLVHERNNKECAVFRVEDIGKVQDWYKENLKEIQKQSVELIRKITTPLEIEAPDFYIKGRRLSTIEVTEMKLIKDTMKENKGNRRISSKLIGISERTLYRKLQVYGLIETNDKSYR